jgi:hypothetical protein
MSRKILANITGLLGVGMGDKGKKVNLNGIQKQTFIPPPRALYKTVQSIHLRFGSV